VNATIGRHYTDSGEAYTGFTGLETAFHPAYRRADRAALVHTPGLSDASRPARFTDADRPKSTQVRRMANFGMLEHGLM
jgi:hypothetical protein